MSAPATAERFDLCGPLPTGVTVLEASAGTGKTFAIAALAARYVAEAGIPLERLLIVSFTRMATGELRERVRERLVTAQEGLARALRGEPPKAEDEVLIHLADGPPDVVEERRRRLEIALADFDAATITTTHGFCHEVLVGLGVDGDVERGVEVVESLPDLVREVVDDLYVRRFHREGDAKFSRATALEIARRAIDNPWAPIEPKDAPPDSTPAMRRRLALAARREYELRKRRAGLLTFDDLLTRLCETLTDEVRGPDACERLRRRYSVALIDEFQDTDPIQWEIVRRAFGEGGATLVLIGDPKQAIYAFRGADVHAYLEAAAHAGGRRATLGVNWRSDQALISAYDALFGPARLGHEEISYLPVQAAEGNADPRLVGAPSPAPLRFRVVHRDDGEVALTPAGYAQKRSTQRHIARDLAADVVRTLSSGAQVLTRRRDGAETGRRPVRPGDIAVLVRTNKQSALVRDALEEVGVPAVINGAGSVFLTETAREWERLLEALERPSSRSAAASAALTPFLGWSAARVAEADEEAWEEVHAKLHRWAGLLRRRGVAALLEAISAGEGLPARMLARAEGERELTDLRHIGQLLHAAAVEGELGVTALAGWLRQRIAEAGGEADDEDRARRLDSDAEAVQVLTIHRAKGLEFPIVYCPFTWERDYIEEEDRAMPVFHDPANDGRRTIDVGGPQDPGFQARYDLYWREQRGEDLRLLYVALTRARHQAVVWWAAAYESRESPLGRLLFFRDPDGTVALKGDHTPADEAAVARLEELAAEAPGCIAVERCDGGSGERWVDDAPAPGELEAAPFERTLDPRWRRSSYSAIVSEAHEAGVGSEDDEAVVDDELHAAVVAPPADGGEEERLRAIGSPWAGLPVGAGFGTVVHRVLERVDFAAPDLATLLVAETARERAVATVDLGPPGVLEDALLRAVETPLGPLAGGLRLRDLRRQDRLQELSFELPVAGGDEPAGALRVAAVAELLGRHLPADDPLAGYPERLAALAPETELRGYLTGSIDLVARVPGPDGPRFAVVDHKTNWLAPPGEPLTAWHHRRPALAAAMAAAHYPLQALLYQVALHRYLRWRMPGYDPERHLAGVLYLFLRGMVGPGTPAPGGQPLGVFAWRPAPALVQDLSDLIDRGAPA